MKRSLKYLFITLATFISLPSLAADSYDGGIIYMSPGETKTISNSGGMNQYNHYNGFDWSWGVAGSWSGTVVSGINIVSSSFNQCTIKANSNLKDHDMELTFSFYYWQYSQYTDMNKYVYDFTYLIKYKEPEGIKIDEDHFPDENFRNYLLGMSYGKDGILTDSEISQISSFSFYKKDIKSLKGIEYFTALKILACDNNPLTELDISNNTALEKLTCLFCQLTSLDVSKNTALTYLDCQKNKLTTLDVSKNTALSYLSFGYNQLANIDVSKNTALEGLVCFDNQLTALDVSKNTALRTLSCDGNQLTTLDVSNNLALRWLSCGETQFTTLDVSKNKALTHLSCFDGELTTLDVSKNTALTELNCRDCKLTTLDVSKNTALKELDCGSNKLTSLDVSKNVALERLYCYINRLTTLDLSRNAALEYVYCYDNQLTSLVVANNSNLYEIEFHMNLISGENMDILINSLPMNTTGEEHHFVLATKSDEQNCTKAQVEAIKAKGWLPKYVDGDDYDGYIYVTDIALNNTTLNLNLYDTYSLIATVEPDNATDKTVSWSSSNTSIATVDSNGKVTAVGTGTVSITCTANGGSSVKATCEVTVTQTLAYAVLSKDGKTVTFYYDDKKESRGGIDIHNYSINDDNPYVTATTAIFDASFANYRPTSTAGWFYKCSELTSIKGIENLHTDDVTNMHGMFYSCNNLTSLNIKGFNTEKVSNMRLMFANCFSLEKLDVSGFKMDNVKITSYMFTFCHCLTTLDLSSFNTSNVKEMTRMFAGCNSLTTVYVNEKKWNTANVTEGNDVFVGCTVLVGGNGTKFDESHTNVEYARIDKAGSPGYFTDIAASIVNSITLNKTKLSLQTNQVETLTATVMPDNVLEKTVTWSSSNTNVATVDDSGKVTAISAGTASITCTANGGSNVKATCEVTVTNPKPEKIILPAEATVTAGNAITLTPTITPADAIYTLTWTSDDESIATVDANGVVTGIKKGQTFINVETDNGKTAYCKLTVTEPEKKVTSITLNMSTMSLVKGESQDLYPTIIEPEDATDKTVTWSSSNDKVATVDANGKVVAVAGGDATITCTANDGCGVSASCVVTVILLPDFITLTSPVTVVSGQTITLTPEITPANAVTTLTWTSDDETIATVDANGVVTGIKKGQTFINVETDNGKTAYCKLTVTAPEPVEIILPKNATVIVGEPLKLTPTLTPEDAETVLTWYSDDETIVRVTADGTLIGVAEGLAIVTAKASNGITSNACKVKVELPSAISDVQTDIKAKTPIYTVSGQRIKTLRKGINIVGGKKVVIKKSRIIIDNLNAKGRTPVVRSFMQ